MALYAREKQQVRPLNVHCSYSNNYWLFLNESQFSNGGFTVGTKQPV